MNKKMLLAITLPFFVLLSTKTFATTDVYSAFRAECSNRPSIKWLPFADQRAAFEACLKGELARFQQAGGKPTWGWVYSWGAARYEYVPLHTR